MEAEEIKDRDSLKEWLEGRPKATRQSDAVAIATCSALRVFPLWSGRMDEVWAQISEETALPILRQLLTPGVARTWPNRESRAAATAAGFFAADIYETALPATLLAAEAAFSASDAAAASAAARAAIVSSADATNSAARAANAAVAAIFEGTDAMWEQVSADAAMIRDGADPFLVPLWSIPIPDWFSEMDHKTRAIWAADPAPWSFWLRWWDGVLAGRPLDWELQKQVALIPDEVWKQGPAAVAEAIAEIETRYALAVTDNAEVIEPDPSTGRLALVPTSALPDEIGTYARRKIAKAVGLFDASASLQMYGSLSVDLVMLREAVTDAGNMPVELYDACASASRRVMMRAATGECPPVEKDAVLGDYLSRLREVGADILAHDPQTQAVLERRNAITGNTAFIDAGPQIIHSIQLIVVVTSGRLETALVADGKAATDPKTDPEDRKAATFRLVGRILRISKWVAGIGFGAGATVVFAAEVIQAIPVIQASPFYQAALTAIMRWLGMA